MKTKQLAADAMLIAMYFVLSITVSLNLGNIKITFDSLPIIVAGALFGPVDGLLVGLLGSFLNQLYYYGLTATTVIWIIPAGVRGLLIGLYAKRLGFNMSTKQTQFITVSTAVIVTVLNTAVMYIDSKYYGYYTPAYVFGMLIPRFISGIIIAFIFGAILPHIVKHLRNFLISRKER